MTAMTRPDPWYTPEETPKGHHFEAVPEDDGWRLPDSGGEICSAKRCHGEAVAVMRRLVNPRGTGFAYLPLADRVARWERRCDEHMYGRWIEGGQVMRWRLVKDGGQ